MWQSGWRRDQPANSPRRYPRSDRGGAAAAGAGNQHVDQTVRLLDARPNGLDVGELRNIAGDKHGLAAAVGDVGLDLRQGFGIRPWRTTFAPCLANASAISAPMPRELPVTRPLCRSGRSSFLLAHYGVDPGRHPDTLKIIFGLPLVITDDPVTQSQAVGGTRRASAVRRIGSLMLGESSSTIVNFCVRSFGPSACRAITLRPAIYVADSYRAPNPEAAVEIIAATRGRCWAVVPTRLHWRYTFQ